MGAVVRSGTIRIGISGLELEDAKDEEAAREDIRYQVEYAISNACSAYSQGLYLESIDLGDVELTAKVAQVRLTASVDMKVAWDESQGDPTPEDWASDYGWNFLVFESGDVDFDYTLLDGDTGDDPEDDTDWSSTSEPVEDGREAQARLREREREAKQAAHADNRRLLDILARVRRHGADHLASYMDPELAEHQAYQSVENNPPTSA